MKAYYILVLLEILFYYYHYFESLWVSSAFCQAVAKCRHFWVAHVQLLSHVWLFATLWTAARQASLPFAISRSLLKLLSIASVMPSNHLVLYHPLLLPSLFPSFGVFSNESALHIRWPNHLELWLEHQSFQWIVRTDFLLRQSCGDLSPRYCLSYGKPSLDYV